MKLVNLFILPFFISSCAIAEEKSQDYYKEYSAKVESCIEIEKVKEPLLAIDVKGIPRNDLFSAIFYLKEKRIAECSSIEELSALAQEISNSQTNIDRQVLTDRYLSISLVDREKTYLEIDGVVRELIIKRIGGKNLEINILDLFDSL